MTKKFEKVRKNRDKMNALKLKHHCFSLGEKKYFSRIYTGLTRLSKGIEIQESGVAHSCIQVVCSEPMFLEYSKSWKDLEIDKLLDF